MDETLEEKKLRSRAVCCARQVATVMGGQLASAYSSPVFSSFGVHSNIISLYFPGSSIL